MRPFPQRLITPAPIGSLLKRAEGIARVMNEQTVGDDAYLKLIRQLPCLKCGLEPAGEAAHVRLSSAAFHKHRHGTGFKPEAKWCLPLCSGDHWRDEDALHRVGEYHFWHEVGVSPFLACERLYAARGDLVRMRAVAIQIIAERGA